MSKQLRKKIKKVHGVGINDADYFVEPVIEGHKVTCPYYQCWRGMIKRCYSESSLLRNPTYKGCSVAEPWLSFMSFRLWMMDQDWHGKQLDKDTLYPGNKIYSPSTCAFVTREVNSLLTDSRSTRGEYPQGVFFDKHNNNFKASCSSGGDRLYLGRFKSAEEASEAYKDAKKKRIIQVALTQPNHIFKGLMRHVAVMEQTYE